MNKELDRKLAVLAENEGSRPMICIQYYVSDDDKFFNKKSFAIGLFEGFDEDKKFLMLSNGFRIPVSGIFILDGDIFRDQHT